MNLTATTENGRAQIELRGTTSKWRETEIEFISKVEELIKSGTKDVHIYINSPGSECFETNEIMDVIRKLPGKITGEGDVPVVSAATYTATNCTSLSISANGLFMIHQVGGGICGRVADIKSTLEVMRKLGKHYLNVLLSECTDKKKIRDAWERGNYWMSAQEAEENDFVTEITGKAKADKAMAQMITNYGHTDGIGTIDSVSNERSKNDMDLTMLTTRSGMDASTTRVQPIAQVDVWKHKADRVDMLERQEEARRKQETENILNSATKEKRTTADVRDGRKASLASNFDTAKEPLDIIKPAEMPEVHVPNLTGTTNRKFEDSQNDPEVLEDPTEKNPAEHERLLNDYVRRDGK